MAIALHRTDTRGGRDAPAVEPFDQDADTAPPEELNNDDEEPLWKRTLSLLFTLAVIVVAIYFWPATLGGATRLVIVSGTSMEPTYDLGDIVVTRDGDEPAIGDTVVFEVPEGTAEGQLVIHRIVRIDDDGRFITQGDNRDTADQWPLAEDDIVGEPLLHIPKGGIVVRFLQQIWVLAIVIGLLVIFVLWPDEEDEQDEETSADDALEPEPRPAIVPIAAQAAHVAGPHEPDLHGPDLDETAEYVMPFVVREPEPVVELPVVGWDWTVVVDEGGVWSTRTIDDATMREAETWLDEQLADALGHRTPVAH